MSDPMDRFLDQHHKRLSSLAESLNEFKAKVGDDREATKASIDQELDRAKAAVRRVKDDAAAAQARMKAQSLKKKSETNKLVAEWIRTRDIDRLERWAGEAQAYAAWSVLVAGAAIDEARLATLRAIAARRDLDTAAASPPPNPPSGPKIWRQQQSEERR